MLGRSGAKEGWRKKREEGNQAVKEETGWKNDWKEEAEVRMLVGK